MSRAVSALSKAMAKMRTANLSTLISTVAMAIVLALFAVTATISNHAIAHNTQRQQQLRQAQIYRARLLRLQIDEETGIRGFTATGDRIFLQPYTSARRQFGRTAALLANELRNLGLTTTSVVQERELNDRWIASIAVPLLQHPSRESERKLQLEGKSVVDAFRANDNALFGILAKAAQSADASSARTVSQVSMSSFIAGLAIAIVFTALAILQARAVALLEVHRRAYEDEKRIADMLQEAFIRKDLPALPAADLHAVYMPAGMEAKVGGDWYDAFELVDRRILFSIGDVAGHGIDAAVVMSRIRQAILSIGIEERDPSKILSRANKILLMQDTTMVTAVCGFIDLANGIVTYSTAGHPPIIIAHADGSAETLPYWGPPLGAADLIEYKNFSIAVEPDATLILYTDGLIEQSRDIEAGEKRLMQAVESLNGVHGGDPAAALMESVFGGEPPRDDVAILTINFRERLGEDATLSADMTAAAGRPIVDRSVRELLQSVMPEIYSKQVLSQARASFDEQKFL